MADAMLVLVGLFWGSSFPIIKQTLDQTSVANLLFIRFALAWVMLLPLAWLRRKSLQRRLFKPGLICGLFLFFAFFTQAWGLTFTSASRSAFITGMNVVLVPVLTMVIFRRIPGRLALAGVLVALAGLYALTVGGQNQELPFNRGDLLTLFCALCIAGHILALGHYSPGRDSFWLAFLQFTYISAAGLVWALAKGELRLDLPLAVWAAIAYLALTCTVIAFWVQTWAQAFTTPTRTSLIFTLEPVFGAICAYLILGEYLGKWGFLGGALILCGIVLAELKPQVWAPTEQSAPAPLPESCGPSPADLRSTRPDL